MDPTKTIEPWLVACGKQNGIRQVHEDRWPDHETRQYEKYCTYRMTRTVPETGTNSQLNSKTDYTAHRRNAEFWLTTVVIDMHGEQDGLRELASYCVAARGNDVVKRIFGNMCAFREALNVVNLTERDDDDTENVYHHRLTCVFEEIPEFTFDDPNAVVDEINLTIKVDGA